MEVGLGGILFNRLLQLGDVLILVLMEVGLGVGITLDKEVQGYVS